MIQIIILLCHQHHKIVVLTAKCYDLNSQKPFQDKKIPSAINLLFEAFRVSLTYIELYLL